MLSTDENEKILLVEEIVKRILSADESENKLLSAEENETLYEDH